MGPASESQSCLQLYPQGCKAPLKDITHHAPAEVFKFFYLLVSLRYIWSFFVHDMS